MDGELTEAYQRLHTLGPEFGGDEEGNHGLTNHAPMAAEVLVRRGRSHVVQRWLDDYVPRLVELPATHEPIDGDSWPSALGDGSRIPDWSAYFSAQLQEHPWRQVLADWWPRLLPGIVAGATHGVIRVGHSVRALASSDAQPLGDDVAALNELAHGLAFWAGRSRTVPGVRKPAGRLDPANALELIEHLPDQTGRIADRVTKLGDLQSWPTSTASLRPAVDDNDVLILLEALIDAATLRYLRHGYGSPVLLVHTATAPNAVLHTLPSLPRHLWQPSLHAAWAASAAVVAAYEPAQSLPCDRISRSLRVADPSSVLEHAVDHGDEHVIKFTDTALEVFGRTENPGALAAALMCASLIESPSR